MSDPTAPAARPRRGLREKRQAITDGALRVFGREGYTRASIGEIAKEADVSTRTIYNHFTDKDELFRTVIAESAARVRDTHLAVVERYLGNVTDLHRDLSAFARALVGSRGDFPDHFAVVRQIQAEVLHLPEEVLDAWQDAGPRPVQRALAERLAALGDAGLLDVPDPVQAASHLMLLAGSEVGSRSFSGARPLDPAEQDALVDAGVAVFIRAYEHRS